VYMAMPLAMPLAMPSVSSILHTRLLRGAMKPTSILRTPRCAHVVGVSTLHASHLAAPFLKEQEWPILPFSNVQLCCLPSSSSLQADPTAPVPNPVPPYLRTVVQVAVGAVDVPPGHDIIAQGNRHHCVLKASSARSVDSTAAAISPADEESRSKKTIPIIKRQFTSQTSKCCVTARMHNMAFSKVEVQTRLSSCLA